MTVGYDAFAYGNGAASSGSPLNWSHVSNGDFLVVGLVQSTSIGSSLVTGVTVGGVPLSLSSAGWVNQGTYNCAQYVLANPGTGTLSISVSVSGSVNLAAVSTTFTNGGSASGATSATGAGTTAHVNVSTSVGSMIVNCVGASGSGISSNLGTLVYAPEWSTASCYASTQAGDGSTDATGCTTNTAGFAISALCVGLPSGQALPCDRYYETRFGACNL